MSNYIFPVICAIQTRVCLFALLISLFASITWIYQERKISNLEDEVYFLQIEKRILEEEIKTMHR